MTEHTREKPFEFEGVKVWRREDGAIGSSDSPYRLTWITPAEQAGLLAFIEAERTGWHWTNDDHTEARCGRWAMRNDGSWVLHHDDLIPADAAAPYWTGPDGYDYRLDAVIVGQFKSFERWRAEQDVPEEPTDFGYVGTLIDPGGNESDVFHGSPSTAEWTVVDKSTGSYHCHSTWADARGTNEFERAVQS